MQNQVSDLDSQGLRFGQLLEGLSAALLRPFDL
jgi:hypothetical protein